MNLNDFTKRYFFLKDENIIYDRTRRESIGENILMSRMLTAGFELPAITSFIEALKLSPISRSSLDRRKGPLVALDAAYEELRPYLPFRTHLNESNLLLYVLLPNGELKSTGVADKDRFVNRLISNPDVYAAVMDIYRRTDDVNTKLDRSTFFEALYKRTIIDPELFLEEPPALISWDASVPALKILDPSILKPGPHPNWDSFTSRMNFPETYKAFVWSIFEPLNNGRQALWLQGEGQDGKSYSTNAIAKFLGLDHVLSMSTNSIKGDFFTGMAYGKRLAVYMDCMDPFILRSAKIKSMIAGDIQDINAKNEKQFAAKVYCRFIVLSNYAPQINPADPSELSRLLHINIKRFPDHLRGDPLFEQKLLSEMGPFLYSCKTSYAAQCPTHSELIVPPTMEQNILVNCSALDANLINEFVSDCIDFGDGPSYMTKKTELASALKGYLAKRNHSASTSFTFENLVRMLKQSGIQETIIQRGVFRISAYSGIKLKKDLILLDKDSKVN